MTRFELMNRISSLELSAWVALNNVRAEEEQYARDVAASGDGVVTGDPTVREDEEDDLPIEEQAEEQAEEERDLPRVIVDGETE